MLVGGLLLGWACGAVRCYSRSAGVLLEEGFAGI